jgi:tRNA-dihydrouridine synthase A
MMQHTDRHFRVLLRQITRHTLLYTEMVTTGALLHGNAERHLGFSEVEHPLSLQLGGDNPKDLAQCARMAEALGYDEVNLNVGCPSDRVQRGRFGACLMDHPEQVAEGVAAMRAAVGIPVTVKHRIGVDEKDRYEDLLAFVTTVAGAGADRFTVHARKAWLKGLSPKQNRNVPPLRYDLVHRLKAELPFLAIEINGGFKTLAQIQAQLGPVDAVMVGRAAVDNPWIFSEVDTAFFGDPAPPPRREEVVLAMADYAEGWLTRQDNGRMGHIARHMLQLFHGEPGARRWRQVLSESAFQEGAGPEVLSTALAARA